MNSKEIKAYQCEKCGKAYMYKYDADKCCEKATKLCQDCGCEIPKSHAYIVCDECKIKREMKYELDRYNKATHYTFDNAPPNSTEYVYSELYPYNEGFIDELDEDIIKEHNIKYVYGTTRVSPFYDAQDMVESMLEESYEDAMSNVSDEEMDRLQFAIDTFIKNHDGCLDHFEVDYHTVIDLDKGDK